MTMSILGAVGIRRAISLHEFRSHVKIKRTALNFEFRHFCAYLCAPKAYYELYIELTHVQRKTEISEEIS